MTGEKFTLMQYSISAILGLIEADDSRSLFADPDLASFALVSVRDENGVLVLNYKRRRE